MSDKPKAPFGRPFKKGQSGNPSGRPRTTSELREALRDPELCAAAVANLRAGVLARDLEWTTLYFKYSLPAQSEVDVKAKLDVSPAASLTTEQLMELAKKR